MAGRVGRLDQLRTGYLGGSKRRHTDELGWTRKPIRWDQSELAGGAIFHRVDKANVLRHGETAESETRASYVGALLPLAGLFQSSDPSGGMSKVLMATHSSRCHSVSGPADRRSPGYVPLA